MVLVRVLVRVVVVVVVVHSRGTFYVESKGNRCWSDGYRLHSWQFRKASGCHELATASRYRLKPVHHDTGFPMNHLYDIGSAK